MRILITGANGFVGKYLVAELVRRGHQIYACMRNEKDAFHEPVHNEFFDMSNKSMLFDVIERRKPEGIIHLAAQSIVEEAWKDPIKTFHMNTSCTLSLLEAVKTMVPKAKVLTVGSSEEYGLTGKLGVPLTESDPCLPQNPYATSKLAAGLLALQISNREQLNVIHARPFNHFGPGQREGFVMSDFASQIARIESFRAPPVVTVGDLSARRDFTDVRDVVEAYIKLIETEVTSGVYNICSGIPVMINDILDFYLSRSPIAIEVRLDPTKYRKSEVPLFIGTSRKLQQATSWKPNRDFKESLSETLEWWRKMYDTKK